MDTFSPELVGLLCSGPASDEVVSLSDESLSPDQQDAWDQLAERVSAARSVY